MPKISNNMIRKVMLVASVCFLTGCSAQVAKNSFTREAGRILIDADEKGMRAFGDLITGSITVGKASGDIETAHHLMRKDQARVEMMKYGGGSDYTSESFTGSK